MFAAHSASVVPRPAGSCGAGEIAPYQLLYMSCETLGLKIQTWGKLGRAKPSDQRAGCSGRGVAFEMCFDLFHRLRLALW
jgi:hypothetical protein